MPYTPNQNVVYLAAFAGALAGMASNRILGPTVPATYAALASAADAFAQSFDTQYGAVKPSALFQQELIAELSESAWQDVAPPPTSVSSLPASYTAMCNSLIAMVDEATAQIAAEGVGPFGNEWTAYTPTFNTQNADGALGDGVIQGMFKIEGDSLFYSIILQWGTTTNGGTGFFVFGLPPGIVVDNAKMLGFGIGLSSGVASQTSVANATFPLFQLLAADLGPPINTVVAFGIGTSATGAFLDAADPFAWAPTDQLLVEGVVAIA